MSREAIKKFNEDRQFKAAFRRTLSINLFSEKENETLKALKKACDLKEEESQRKIQNSLKLRATMEGESAAKAALLTAQAPIQTSTRSATEKPIVNAQAKSKKTSTIFGTKPEPEGYKPKYTVFEYVSMKVKEAFKSFSFFNKKPSTSASKEPAFQMANKR